jgi:hypothetical protein
VPMSTRKLILTALVCGIAIVLAGGIKLLQVAKETTKVTVLGFGDRSTLGDMTVSVLGVASQTDRTVVTVMMSGVSGADAVEGWRMLAGGKVSEVLATPWTGVDAPACSTTTVEGGKCSLVFGPSTGTVTVAYLRAGKQSQWSNAG